jgi:hypothetical protein
MDHNARLNIWTFEFWKKDVPSFPASSRGAVIRQSQTGQRVGRKRTDVGRRKGERRELWIRWWCIEHHWTEHAGRTAEVDHAGNGPDAIDCLEEKGRGERRGVSNFMKIYMCVYVVLYVCVYAEVDHARNRPDAIDCLEERKRGRGEGWGEKFHAELHVFYICMCCMYMSRCDRLPRAKGERGGERGSAFIYIECYIYIVIYMCVYIITHCIIFVLFINE